MTLTRVQPKQNVLYGLWIKRLFLCLNMSSLPWASLGFGLTREWVNSTESFGLNKMTIRASIKNCAISSIVDVVWSRVKFVKPCNDLNPYKNLDNWCLLFNDFLSGACYTLGGVFFLFEWYMDLGIQTVTLFFISMSLTCPVLIETITTWFFLGRGEIKSDPFVISRKKKV